MKKTERASLFVVLGVLLVTLGIFATDSHKQGNKIKAMESEIETLNKEIKTTKENSNKVDEVNKELSNVKQEVYDLKSN